MIQEFPKMLYQGDAQRVVADADEQAAAIAEGWHLYGEQPKVEAEAQEAAAEPKKPGRKPKVEAEA